MIKTCKFCGNTFETQSNRACYCSDRCKQQGRIKTTRAWREKTGYRIKQRDALRAKRAKASQNDDKNIAE